MGAPDQSIALDLLRLALRCRDIDKTLSSRTGLTIDEMHCISVIHTEKSTCAKHLSELLKMNATRTSKILGAMERLGFVQRDLDPSDHRKEQITLTAEGEHAATRILSLYEEAGEVLLRSWGTEFAGNFHWLQRALLQTRSV